MELIPFLNHKNPPTEIGMGETWDTQHLFWGYLILCVGGWEF